MLGKGWTPKDRPPRTWRRKTQIKASVCWRLPTCRSCWASQVRRRQGSHHPNRAVSSHNTDGDSEACSPALRSPPPRTFPPDGETAVLEGSGHGRRRRAHTRPPPTPAGETQAPRRLAQVNPRPPRLTGARRSYKIPFYELRLKLTCQVQMIVFTSSVRSNPPHKSPQEHEAFNDNLLGVNYVQESSSHPSRQ